MKPHYFCPGRTKHGFVQREPGGEAEEPGRGLRRERSCEEDRNQFWKVKRRDLGHNSFPKSEIGRQEQTLWDSDNEAPGCGAAGAVYHRPGHLS